MPHTPFPHVSSIHALPDGPAARWRAPLRMPRRSPVAFGLALAIWASFSAHAGDILRGGTTSGPRGGKGASGGVNPGAEIARTNARDVLARTTSAVLSVKKMQEAARAAALKGPNNLGADPNFPGRNLPNVPDGLTLGGLQLAPGVPKNLAAPQTGENPSLWRGALLPKQTSADGRKLVVIEQLRPQAVLTWQTFNVGKKTTVKFNQGRGGEDKSQWTAFNKIVDPSGSPSQILGNIEASGQVFVINPNGILFGGSSQINLHGLVASSLPINDNLIARGLINNPDSQFLFSALPIATGAKGTPAFTPPPSSAPGGKYGDVVVQPGATITSPTTSANVGGRVMLIGANVKNEGTLSTPDGQTVLAAGLQVGVRAHPGDDARLRGLDIFVGAVKVPPPATPEGAPLAPPQNPAGTATNSGLIDAPRANATIAGKTVNQLGVIDSSTTVSLNGSINLEANYNALSVAPSGVDPFFAFTASGTVTLGPGSVAQILPEWENASKVVGTQLALRSRAKIQGRNVHFGEHAILLAPNADVTVEAGEWLPIASRYDLINSSGQIYLDAGAIISVAGSTDVLLEMAQNVLSLQLRGVELADSPLQRTGPLRGPTLNLDIRQRGVFNGREWVGTPLGDAAGYVGLIERGVGELTAAGGTIALTAGSSVVLQTGSKLDVSGGYLNFQDGMVQTTRVISDGRIVNIANATPDRPFTGIYDGSYSVLHPKYGIMEKWTHPLALSGEYFEPGYVEGKNGGSITVKAPSMALDGELLGQTIAGPRQRTAAETARLSALSLTFEKRDAAVTAYHPYSPTPPAITFGEGTPRPVADFSENAAGHAAALSNDRIAEVLLSPKLFTIGGFGSLTVNNGDGSIAIPAEVEIKTPARGSLTLLAANLDVQGKVTSPGGTISLTTYNFTPYQLHFFKELAPTNSTADPSRGNLTLGATAALSTAGLVVDDRPLAAAPLSLPLALDGGPISLAGYNVALAPGSVLDASGGVAFAKDGKRTYGAGGNISIKAGNDPLIPQLIGGKLDLGAQLLSFSGGKGGGLTIQAPSIQIGGVKGPTEYSLVVDPKFFSQGGFTSFTLIGLGEIIDGPEVDYIPGVSVLPGTQIRPVVETLSASPYGGPEGVRLDRMVDAVGVRSPVNITLSAPGVRDTFTADALVVRGALVFGEGALLQTDPRGSLTLTGETVTVLGSLVAPAGSITVTGSSNPRIAFGNNDFSVTSVYLGPNSRLSAQGAVVYTPNAFGLRTGSVLPGGRIAVAGNIFASRGAVLDVSGTSGILDLAPVYTAPMGEIVDQSVIPMNSGVNNALYTRTTVPTRVESDGGEIVLAGGQQLFTSATLRGAAGGPSALGGSLTISSGRFYPQGSDQPKPTDTTLQVTQSGAPYFNAGLGEGVRGADGALLPGYGRFAVDDFARGGFDSLTLRGTVEFSGPVSITARRQLTVADAGIIFANDVVHLTAPYVVLGKPFLPPVEVDKPQDPFLLPDNTRFNFKPVFGPGSLTVTADLIDIGNLSLQNIGAANFIAENGDIRGDGTLNVAGTLRLRAAQIYPPTAVKFTISVADYKIGEETFSGRVIIENAGTRELPLSAGGQLSIFGSIIEQHGTLRAPLGGITLGWDGTGAAPLDPITNEPVAVTKSIVLGAGSLTSVSAVSPIDGAPLLIPFGLNVNGVTWVDPAGQDITVAGVPQKTIQISGLQVHSLAGSSIDIQGGGDLFAYRWVPGIGGSKDVLATTTSFAVVPTYGAAYAPYAPYNPGPSGFKGDAGYVNNSLKVGDRVHLGAAAGLPEGDYTLLPARYALLPGAYLVSLKSGAPLGTLALPDGSMLVPGYRYNGLNAERELNPQMAWFEVLSPAAIRSRSEFAAYGGNEFLLAGAQAVESAPPRLPSDAGHLKLSAATAMTLQGRVSAQAPVHSRAGLVDVASSSDIVVTARGGSQAGKLVLNASELNAFGAESLLIGGFRTVVGNTASVSVRTGNVTVDNAGGALKAPEIILVAKNSLVLGEGAQIIQLGKISGPASTLLIGDAAVAGSGDGTLLRVSSDPSARIVRVGLGTSTTARMGIGAGALVSGGSVILDSTYGTELDPSARLVAGAISLNSGQISIQLENPGALNSTEGLILSGTALQSLERSQSVSLLSYSTIDLYGTGTFSVAGELALHAARIRGFNNAGGTTTIAAGRLLLDNQPNVTVANTVVAAGGTLEFRADTITLGKNQLFVDRYATVELQAARGIVGAGTGGFTVQQDLLAKTPVLTAARSATQSITAGGLLTFDSAGSSGVSGGLGASLTLKGASVSVNSDIILPSGLLTIQATTGDVKIDGRVSVNGTTQQIYDLVGYTGGGQIRLISDLGSVMLGADSVLSVSAPLEGGNAGSLLVSAANGSFSSLGDFSGRAGARGLGGTFALDTKALTDFAGLNTALADGGFSESQSFRIRTGDITLGGLVSAHQFRLSTDTGNITVTGKIDASGVRGGEISLMAGKNLVLAAGSELSVLADDFSSAGAGGAVTLETRGVDGGKVDIQAGSTIDLGVKTAAPDSQAYGQFTGTLHVRAPQVGSDLAVQTIGGTITGASSIIVEGYKVFDLAGTNGVITPAKQAEIKANSVAFIGDVALDGVPGNAAAGYNAMLARVLGTNTSLSSVLSIRAGVELTYTGKITLGVETSNPTQTPTLVNDWNLATWRFGAKAAPGILTIRTGGDLVLFNSITDGFVNGAYNSGLLEQNAALPLNAQSWSYRLTAGADLTAADYSQVKSLGSLAPNAGSLLLGQNAESTVAPIIGQNASTANSLRDNFQTIRTGSGHIDISAGRDVRFMNIFSTIYTAGTRVADPTVLPNGGTFEVSELNNLSYTGGVGTLGGVQQTSGHIPEYTLGGGHVTITAGADIAHYTKDTAGNLIADSAREMPINWLYRRGYVDPATGEFGVGATAVGSAALSTSWWVDFSNFFQSVGTFGGGDIKLTAGRNIANVDASAATNARMAKGVPNASSLVELGGGDVTVRAGNNLDGGVYYVERGHGELSAGGSITTNRTRSVSLGNLNGSGDFSSETAWLPTTLFLGKAHFDVSARGDLLLGPAVNPFLLPGGYNNSFLLKSYFSTYGAESGVTATSLSGDVTLRLAIPPPGAGGPGPNDAATPILAAWFTKQFLYTPAGGSAAFLQPWLRLNESNVGVFNTAMTILPGTLKLSAFAGDVNLVGSLNLSPSPRGTLEIAASGSVNGLNPTGLVRGDDGVTRTAWSVARVNISDANPNSIFGIATPFAYQTVGGIGPGARETGNKLLLALDSLFAETGSTRSVLQVKQALHAPGLLHAGDSDPLRIYAGEGDISGLTLFSPKAARVLAGRDLTDVAFYIQNIAEENISVVAAGRDITLYHPNSPRRVQAVSPGNVLNFGSVPLAGDLQVSGPGTLEVLAGRNLDLGVGPNATDGTALGILSVGNARNPFLPFAGADLVVGAGLGPVTGLDGSAMDFTTFVGSILSGPVATRYETEIATMLGGTGSIADFESLPEARRNLAALELFYLMLRDAGRDHNDETSPGFDNYDGGFAAVEALFPGTAWKGDLSLTAREIKTQSGGEISIFAPGGNIIVGFDAGSNQALDQGILTESGGSINIFAHGNVSLGTSRIFTLRGGNEIIWSTVGDIAAGNSSKTVQSAPPTRVLIDPQSADLKTDLAGLATGGGIGVLATVVGVEPGDVDLIAPGGAIDAGEAGIRSAGNLNVASTIILNAENIQVAGTTAGAPTSVPAAAPNLGSIATAQAQGGAQTVSSQEQSRTPTGAVTPPPQAEEPPSIIVVEVLSFGGE